MDHKFGEDEEGKFVVFQKGGVCATLRFRSNGADEAILGAKRILHTVYERLIKQTK